MSCKTKGMKKLMNQDENYFFIRKNFDFLAINPDMRTAPS